MDAPSTAPAFGTRVYGRRRGRPLRPGRSAAMAARLPRATLILPEEGERIDPRTLFPSDLSEIWLEIGFGSGEHLLGQAALHPTIGFIGCEPWVEGVASLLARAGPSVLPRLRVLADDARRLMGSLRDGSLGRISILFPDPWPKRRHHRRRVLQADTLHQLARSLRPGGDLFFASDHAEYVRWTLMLAAHEPLIEWCVRRPSDWRHPPEEWVPTRYQRKAEARGLLCHYLRFRRLPAW